MLKWVTIFATFFISFSGLRGQNLVPNPDFDEYTRCPDGRGQVSLVPPWFSPNNGGVDYINECAGNNGAGVPTNNWGHQFPLAGEGYAGVRVWRGGGLYREYLAVDLVEPLQVGETYFLQFFVTPGDSMRYMTDDIGMYISSEPIPPMVLLPFQPLIANPQAEIIRDFENWTEISGTYTASGGEQHMAIGNFLNEEETTLILRGSESEYHESAYFFVDKVLVENCKNRLPEKILFAEKTDLCPGEELILEGYKSLETEVTYTWQDGSDQPEFVVEEAGEYTLSVMVNGCTKTERVMVEPSEMPDVSLGEDTTLCPGESLILSVGDFNGSWRWGNGSEEREIIVENEGTYFLEASLGQCGIQDSIKIDFINSPPLNSNWDTLVCLGEEIHLKANVEGDTYNWSDMSVDSMLSTKVAGAYWVDVQNACYIWRQNFTIRSEDCGCEAFVPNVMTPNNDGINDFFVPKLKSGIEQFQMDIYDRWGKKVFETRSLVDHWTGHDLQGRPASEGVYYWIMTIECFNDGQFQPYVQKGYLSLLR